MAPEGADPADKCPVDHRTREKWLEAAKARGGGASVPRPHATNSNTTSTNIASTNFPLRFSLDSGTWTFPTRPADAYNGEPALKRPKIYRLSTDREISTIPRALSTNDRPIESLNPAERAALPSATSSPATANNEHSATHDAATGNWVYPSQEQFFSAMQRKGHEASPKDMESIVPIHNAVNERVWKEVLKWERGWGAEKCGGPRLVSFAGDSKALTPRARWNALLGYAPPFDRHDWVVERCGKHVDYVIDFYSGKPGGSGPAGPGRNLSFYLDVRPKLNSWEGIKMRIAKSFEW